MELAMPSLRILALVAVMLASVLYAGDPVPDFGKSVAAQRGDPLPSLANLRGKVVVLVFFQSWCPVCNNWAPELLTQLEESYGSDPRVVLVGVKTDGDASGGKTYLADKGAKLDRWLVIGDAEATYYKRLLGTDALWHYAVIAPDGSLAESGKAGTYFNEGGARKRFVLPAAGLGTKYGSAVEPVLRGTYPEALARAVRLAEAGCPREAIAAAAASGDPKAKDFRDDLLTSLTAQVDTEAAILADAARPGADRVAAYETLTRHTAVLKGTAPGKTATSALGEANKDSSLKAELAALKTWNAMQVKLAQVPAEQVQSAIADAYPRFIKAHPGTVAAARAQAALPR